MFPGSSWSDYWDEQYLLRKQMDHAVVHSQWHMSSADFQGSGCSEKWEMPELWADPEIRFMEELVLDGPQETAAAVSNMTKVK